MNLEGKHIAVVGLGVSGEATARFLNRRGAVVTATDDSISERLKNVSEKLSAEGISVKLGGSGADCFDKADMIVISPGVPHTLAPFERARQRGIPVLGEIELASRFVKAPVAAVTGTNGKTTVTTLLGEMLERSGLKTFVGGNIGYPLIEYADGDQRADLVVLELSSFQLDTIDSFRAHVSVVLNVTDDHMDRYPDFKAYADSKGRIFENQTSGDFAVLNGSDAVVKNMADRIGARKLFFSRESMESLGFGNDFAVVRAGNGSAGPRMNIRFDGRKSLDLDMSIFTPVGIHNLENAASAALAALAAGGTAEGVVSALRDFKGLPHRLQRVALVRGVEFINDSKATNTDAAVKAIETFDRPQVVIMGGRDKDGDFTALKEVVRKKVRRLILIGEAAEKLEGVLTGCAPIAKAFSMEDAVNKAFETSVPGDVVLLAPACASFDMYENYKKRGEDFGRAATLLASRSASEQRRELMTNGRI